MTHMCASWHGTDVTMDKAQYERDDNIGNDIPTDEELFFLTHIITSILQGEIFSSSSCINLQFLKLSKKP